MEFRKNLTGPYEKKARSCSNSIKNLHKISINETLVFNEWMEVFSLENPSKTHTLADPFSPRQWSLRYCNRKLEIVLRSTQSLAV